MRRPRLQISRASAGRLGGVVTSASRSSSPPQSCALLTHFSSPTYRSLTLPSAANHEPAAQLKKSLVSFFAVIWLSPRLCKRMGFFSPPQPADGRPFPLKPSNHESTFYGITRLQLSPFKGNSLVIYLLRSCLCSKMKPRGSFYESVSELLSLIVVAQQ